MCLTWLVFAVGVVTAQSALCGTLSRDLGSYSLQAERPAAKVVAIERVDYSLGLALGYRQEREAVEHHHIADSLAVEAR
jgi:hypothetical protein